MLCVCTRARGTPTDPFAITRNVVKHEARVLRLSFRVAGCSHVTFSPRRDATIVRCFLLLSRFSLVARHLRIRERKRYGRIVVIVVVSFPRVSRSTPNARFAFESSSGEQQLDPNKEHANSAARPRARSIRNVWFFSPSSLTRDDVVSRSATEPIVSENLANENTL